MEPSYYFDYPYAIVYPPHFECVVDERPPWWLSSSLFSLALKKNLHDALRKLICFFSTCSAITLLALLRFGELLFFPMIFTSNQLGKIEFNLIHPACNVITPCSFPSLLCVFTLNLLAYLTHVVWKPGLMDFGAPVIKYLVPSPLFSFWNILNFDLLGVSNRWLLILLQCFKPTVLNGWAIFKITAKLCYLNLIQTMRLIAINECSKHFCRFFFK